MIAVAIHLPHVYDSSEIEREILRMLWTFHFATPDQLNRLLWTAPSGAQRRQLTEALRRLHTLHMVWREGRRVMPGYRSHANARASGGWYYGLTETGRSWAAERMPELTILHCITREGYMHAAERRTITHATHHTEYCTRLIQALRRHPLTVGMFFETESTVMGGHLRMDGLIRLRLYEHAPPATVSSSQGPPWYVPWMPTLRTPTVPGTLDATFALEIDEGTEHLLVLERKARNYQRTFAGNPRGALAGEQVFRDRETSGADMPAVHWHKVLCPEDTPDDIEVQASYFPIPVFVMNSEQRLANVWQAWHQGWPNSEVRMTTWAHLQQEAPPARSVMGAPYLNQDRQWVDLLGSPLAA